APGNDGLGGVLGFQKYTSFTIAFALIKSSALMADGYGLANTFGLAFLLSFAVGPGVLYITSKEISPVFSVPCSKVMSWVLFPSLPFHCGREIYPSPGFPVPVKLAQLSELSSAKFSALGNCAATSGFGQKFSARWFKNI